MLVPLSTDEAAAFRDVFHAVGYSDSKLAETFGTPVPPPPHHPGAETFAERASETSPFLLLARLFFLGLPAGADESAALLPSTFIDICLHAGLIRREGDQLQPQALVAACGPLLLAADLHDSGARDFEKDFEHYVPTLSEPALHLLTFAIPGPFGSTLDLCGGFGLHALAASRFSDSVVTSDLNPRSKPFAEFNAALNDCDHLEIVTGHLFEPIGDRRFDLILCNPPFVISPSAAPTFRGSPLELDQFLQELLTAAPRHLEEGGFFQTTCEWVELEGQDWEDRLRECLKDTGCDVWVLQANRQGPESYTRDKVRETLSDPESVASEQEAWLKYFHDRNVDSIHGGLIFLRRRSGDNWFDVTEMKSGATRPIGEAIRQGFELRDLVFGKDEDLLTTRLEMAEGIRQEESSHWEDNQWQVDSIALRIEDGLPVTIGIDHHVRNLINRFDGERSVDQALNEFAESLGMNVDSARSQALQMVRMLISNAFLVRV